MAGMAGMAGMAERQKEWQNGRMAEMATYVHSWYTPRTTTDDDDNDDDNDDYTLIFYITEIAFIMSWQKGVFVK